jgi:hypothetical protein
MFKTWFQENFGFASSAALAQDAVSRGALAEVRRVLKIVLASPGDLIAERQSTVQVIEKLNRGLAMDRGYHLELRRWETDTYPGFHPLGPQGQVDISLKVDQCDVFIGIFWLRFGTPTTDSQSGTEHEIRVAIKSWNQRGAPHIMLYFSQKKTAANNTRGSGAAEASVRV